MPGNGQGPIEHLDRCHLGIDPDDGMADPAPTVRWLILTASIEAAPGSDAGDYPRVRRLRSIRPERRNPRKCRRPVGEQSLIGAGTAAAEPGPPVLSQGPVVDLLMQAMHAATREHRRRHVIRDVDRHRRKAPAASQAANRLSTPRLDQGNAFLHDVIGHPTRLDAASPPSARQLIDECPFTDKRQLGRLLSVASGAYPDDRILCDGSESIQEPPVQVRSGLTGLPMYVVARIRDLPRRALGGEVGESVYHQPRWSVVIVTVVVAHGQRRSFDEFHAEASDVIQGLSIEVGRVQIRHHPPTSIIHDRNSRRMSASERADVRVVGA